MRNRLAAKEIKSLIAEGLLPRARFGNTLYLFKVDNDPHIMVCEKSELLRWLSEEEQKAFNIAVENRKLFPMISEDEKFKSSGFAMMPSGGHAMSNLVVGYDKTVASMATGNDPGEVEALKTISSLYGYPDPEQSMYMFLYGIGGMIIGFIGGGVTGGLVTGLLGFGLAAAATAFVPGMVIGMLVGVVVCAGIGALYGWYKNNQIDKQIAEEKESYLLVEKSDRGPVGEPTPAPQSIHNAPHTPLGGVLPEQTSGQKTPTENLSPTSPQDPKNKMNQ